MSRKEIIYLTILFIVCFVVLAFRYAGVKGPDSDTAIFPLTAFHLTQGKPFPIFFYGQNYMGTLPVLLMAILFKTIGVSYILVELLYALVVAGIITFFSAFLLRELSFFGVTIFAATFLLFPHVDAVSIVGLKSSLHLFSILLAFVSGCLFCWYLNKIINENKHKTLNELFLPIFLFIILAVLTYWSSGLGFLYLTTITLTSLFGCRKILVRLFSKINPGTKNEIPIFFKYLLDYSKVVILASVIFTSLSFMKFNQWGVFIQLEENMAPKYLSDDSWHNKMQKNLIVPEISVVKKIDIYKLDWINFITVAKKGLQRIIRNIFHVLKIYHHVFSNIIKPFNLIWVFLPLLLGGYYYFSKRIEFLSLIKGDWAKIEFKWVIIFLPILNILASLPTRFLANQDIAFVRYFLSINLAILAVIPLFFSLIQSPKLRNTFLTLYFLFAVGTFVYSKPKYYEGLIDIPTKIKFLKSRYPDHVRLSALDVKLLKFLEKEQLYFGYANYWDSYRLTFLTHERFIISPRLGEHIRYKPYDQLVKVSKHPFYLFRINEGADQKILQKIYEMESNSFRQKRFGDKLVIY